MISTSEARKLVNDLFEEEALVIGGLVAVSQVDDDLVWRLFRNLDVIRKRSLHRIETHAMVSGKKRTGSRVNLKPHPAIEAFLSEIWRT